MDASRVLTRAAALATDYLDTLADRPVGQPVDLTALRAAMGGPLPDGPSDPVAVVEALAAAADPGIVATAGPRFFGFVIGGSLPAALGADVLTAAWDQNAAFYATSPAASIAEEVAAAWLLELLELPAGTSVGFASGATMANFTALAAARHAVLAHVGWDVERLGLQGAPPVTVVTHAGSHATVYASLQMLGLGREGDHVRKVDADAQGRMRADALRAELATIDGPVIVCAQAGNVNTGAFDPFAEIEPMVHERDGWLHIDGAFGIWAAAVPSLHGRMRGHHLADSWSTDAHKWLNVPYDSGLVFVRDAAAHQAAMTFGAAYYVESDGATRDPYSWVPESSRRARGFTVLAALRSLGRAGLVDLIERDNALARRMAQRLASGSGVRILNEVVLNQVLVRFDAPEPDPDGSHGDARTRAVIEAVQRDGTCWLGGTTWAGHAAMRVSVSGWQTTADDIDRSADAILACLEGIGRRGG
ncbi:MAG TPA: aminotransferase class V-fold PLP-dependent enzyme [Candidatus Limnocylindrales bacterium]|nr:aminotransferase class V-fold PLP-dependent enzyme [Candidatus Limnocylindrales bacterium]